jgi:ABC-type sugar transport system substrate-binding protein
MSRSDDDYRMDRRTFAKMLGAAASAATVGGLATAPAKAQEMDWKEWTSSYMGKPIKLAVSCNQTTNPYFTPARLGALDAGAQLDVQVDWTGVPDMNTIDQIAQFDQLIATGYQGILLIPSEADAWIAPIQRATDAGVVVVTCTSDSPASSRELFFGSDLTGTAIQQGELLAKLAGNKGKVALTNCAPGLLSLQMRQQGAEKGVTDNGMTVAGVYNSNQTDMASELALFNDILAATPDLAGLAPLCGPDTAAAGLIRKQKGLTIPVVGNDMMYQTLELIKEGHIDATFGQQPYMQGYLPIMYCYQRAILNAPKLELPDDIYYVATEVVTKENVDYFLMREKRFAG